MSTIQPEDEKVHDAVIVGGGLAGLTAAATLAEKGRRVLLLEKSTALGGRARTKTIEKFKFNQGPHALYRNGAAARILKDLRIPFRGGIPSLTRWLARTREGLFRLPGDARSLILTRLFSPREKFEAMRLLKRLGDGAPAAKTDESLGSWMEREINSSGVRRYLRAIARLSTYSANTDELEAAPALMQLHRAMGGVYYLDDGWQTLVDGLRNKALAHGAQLRAGEKAAQILYENAGRQTRGVRLENGTELQARNVILALDPNTADTMTRAGDFAPLREFAAAARPARAACLEVALRGSVPRDTGMLDLDGPFYVSIHSQAGRLAPENHILVSAMKYGAEGEDVEKELRAALDCILPHREEKIVHERFLPDMKVAWSSRANQPGGFLPDTAVPACAGLHVCGDWVGEGMLADAAMHSARRAAEGILIRGGERAA